MEVLGRADAFNGGDLAEFRTFFILRVQARTTSRSE